MIAYAVYSVRRKVKAIDDGKAVGKKVTAISCPQADCWGPFTSVSVLRFLRRFHICDWPPLVAGGVGSHCSVRDRYAGDKKDLGYRASCQKF